MNYQRGHSVIVYETKLMCVLFMFEVPLLLYSLAVDESPLVTK